MNYSLSRFHRARRRFLIWGFIFLVSGIATSASTLSIVNTTRQIWTSPTDTDAVHYDSDAACAANWDDCYTTTSNEPNLFAPMLPVIGDSLMGLGGTLFGLAAVSSFLIITAESIVEGMGGKISTAFNAGRPKDSEKAE